MRENVTTLYPNEEVAVKVSDYSIRHSVGLGDEVDKYHAWVLESQPRSYYTISILEAQFLTWMARTLGTKRVLEVGSFVGFSLAMWSNAVGPTGLVTGMEFSPQYASLARETLAKTSFQNIEIVEGNALEKITTINPDEPYDMVFIDAQKSGYPAYLASILAQSLPGSTKRLVRPGGIIIGDNALRSALVVDRTDANPATKTVPQVTENWSWGDVEKLDEFNREMHTNPRIEAVLMPLFDGLCMGRLVD